MKLRVFSFFLALINVYFLYVCQPVLADGGAGAYCVRLFEGELKLENKRVDRVLKPHVISGLDHEENVYAVHITKYLPSSGFLKVVTKDRGRFIPTLHFSLGEPVQDHLWGKWSEKPYAIVTPLTSLRNQMLNLYPQDTFILGDFKIPKEAVLFIPHGEPIPKGLPFRIIQYDGFMGVKPAISKFLKESGSIEFKTESSKFGFPNAKVMVGNTDILKNNNLKNFFPKLFRDKPYLTRTLHDDTSWGAIDNVVINYFAKWVEGRGVPSKLETDINLSLYILKDNILALNRVVSQMDLPDYALDSYKQGLQELKSYENLLEVEKDLRGFGHSLFALERSINPDLFSKIVSFRYDKQKLLDLTLSVRQELPEPLVIRASIPMEYGYSLKNSSMEEFLQYINEGFPHPNKETEQQIRKVIASRAVHLLLKGKLTAEQAYPYFRMNAESLTWVDISTRIFNNNILYAIAGDRQPKLNFPHKELLRFLKHPWVHQFLISKNMLKFSGPEFTEAYLKKLDSIDNLKTEDLTGYSMAPNATDGPKGQLIATGKVGSGYTKGKWYLDENNTLWFLKKDVRYNELQTSAEVISSSIYRFFGYDTPQIFKLVLNGIHYAAVKNIGEGHKETQFLDMDTSKIRQMRVVAAYLKDWDRLANPDNNLLKPDGTLTLLDFGGTLGSRARGEHKPGPVFSDAIGNFEATNDIKVIFDSFSVQARDDHPWNKINRSDVQKIITKFPFLSDAKIESIVDRAGYSNPTDRNYMIKALKMRRNGIMTLRL